MDILAGDQALKDEITDAKKGYKPVETDEEPGFHFIAFIPVQGRVWRFDGYESEPQNLGESLRATHPHVTESRR